VAPWLPLALALMPVLGATAIGFAITANSTLQLNSDDSIRGRVMALYSVVFLGSTPIGGPIAGWVGEHLGPRAGLLGGGIIAVVVGLMGVAAARNAIAGAPARASAEPAPTLGLRG
jgi:MFS family permease